VRPGTASCAATEKPITPRADVKVGEEGAARYVADATLATLVHFGQGDKLPKEKITPQIEQLSRAPLYVHALKCLQAAGVRVLDEFDREEMCKQAFAMDGAEQIIRADGGHSLQPAGQLSQFAERPGQQAVRRTTGRRGNQLRRIHRHLAGRSAGL
jgi:hypothetical protein